MQDLSDDERRNVLGEVLMDELRAIREGLDDVPKRAEFAELKETVDKISTDINTVKLAVTDQSKQLSSLDHRVEVLESA